MRKCVKSLVFLFVWVLFSTGVSSQEQEEVAKNTENFGVCLFLTDVGLITRYQTFTMICYLREYNTEKCVEYLKEAIVSEEFENEEEVLNLMVQYRTGKILKLIPEGSTFSGRSFVESLHIRCEETVNLDDKERGINQHEKKVLEAVDCISKEIVLRKQEFNCSD